MRELRTAGVSKLFQHPRRSRLLDQLRYLRMFDRLARLALRPRQLKADGSTAGKLDAEGIVTDEMLDIKVDATHGARVVEAAALPKALL